MKALPLVLLLLTAPALAEEAKLDHEHELTPVEEPTPTATPAPTPMPPLCSDTNPSLTRCLQVIDPAQALNQRVMQLERNDQQLISAYNELVKRVDGLQPKKDVKK